MAGGRRHDKRHGEGKLGRLVGQIGNGQSQQLDHTRHRAVTWSWIGRPFAGCDGKRRRQDRGRIDSRPAKGKAWEDASRIGNDGSQAAESGHAQVKYDCTAVRLCAPHVVPRCVLSLCLRFDLHTHSVGEVLCSSSNGAPPFFAVLLVGMKICASRCVPSVHGEESVLLSPAKHNGVTQFGSYQRPGIICFCFAWRRIFIEDSNNALP